MKRKAKPWKVERGFLTRQMLEVFGHYEDEATAKEVAVKHIATCQTVRIVGPDGVTAVWVNGEFVEH